MGALSGQKWKHLNIEFDFYKPTTTITATKQPQKYFFLLEIFNDYRIFIEILWENRIKTNNDTKFVDLEQIVEMKERQLDV